MKIYYEFFENKSLLIQKFIGVWSIEQYERYMDMASNIPEIICLQKILTDFRDIIINSEVSDIDNLIRIRNKIQNNNYINIHLVCDPISTVTAYLYQEKLNQKGHLYKYCSTISQAIKLLEIDVTEIILESKIKNLKNQF
jgi:hypothetical protein